MTAPSIHVFLIFFFFNDTATTEIYTLSLHDALPILRHRRHPHHGRRRAAARHRGQPGDRKSTRLNSSHTVISYAVFCFKKKKTEAAQGVRYVMCTLWRNTQVQRMA